MSTTAAKKLLSILQSEYQVSRQLLDILLAEREALMKSEIDTISTMAANKQPLTTQLEQLARHREAVLQSQGFPANKAGLEAFIENQNKPEQTMLFKGLTLLRKMAMQCRENNQINGGIVNVNRQYLHRAMSVLRGRDTSISSYGPGGEYTSQVVGQPLLGRV